MDPHQLETFALARDRAKALEQLIPGTEDYYFHACLHHEQTGNFREVEAILAQWIKRHGETTLSQEIRHRLALIRYEADPKKSLEHLRYHLGLEFNHERIVEGRETKYPTSLDPALVSREQVRKTGFEHSNTSDLSGFTDAALEWIAAEPMDGHRLRQFLTRLRRPDCAKLPDLVLAELKDPHSSGFGALPIHNLLLQEQLEALRKRAPELLTVEAFVYACLVRLQPGPDVDRETSTEEREAHLERLWAFVKDLAPKFNALKAHILFHRLDHDRRKGVYDAARFTTYIRLPRQVSYANPEYLKQCRNENQPFSLGHDFRAVTMQSTISSDEELVRDCFAVLFRDAKDFKAWEPYVALPFLKEVFASTKILNGIGDMEQWYSMLNNPGFHQALKDRVEIEFARTNRTWFRASDPVSLSVDVKNVGTLVVKVFEVNSLNYFLANGCDVDTSIDLDGLVASEEKTVTYTEPPFRRVRRTFEFASLAKPGIYVVEFIGGGISSRALIRKGRLRFLERVGSAGHVFTILDEDRVPVKDGSVWIGGREFAAGKDGAIHVPFSTQPGRQSVLLRAGGLTTLEAFNHEAENYGFVAGLYADRESLLKKREAQVLLRPSLQVNGVPVSLELIEEPTLVIQSTDRDGVSSSMEVHDFRLYEDRESTHTFQVPENLASITFTFRGKVQNISQGRKIDIADSRSFALNGIDSGESIEDLHLARTDSGYVVNLCGKSGEPKAGVALNVSLQHRDLTSTLDVTLQTDAEGRVELGHMRDVASLSMTTPSGVSESWVLPRDRFQACSSIHVRAGEAIRVPIMDAVPLNGVDLLDEHGRAAKPAAGVERKDVALLERLGAAYVRDHFKSLGRREGFLEIAGLPAGDYELFFKRDVTTIAIRVAPGEDRDGWIAGERRHLERGVVRPLQISGVKVGKDGITVALGHSNAQTRVHVFGTRFVPAYSGFEELGRAGLPGARSVEVFKGPSQYLSGRDIGDEYRYILERRYSGKFAGNMLTRPGLLLNPWAIRSTETATQEAAAGRSYGAMAAPPACAPMRSVTGCILAGPEAGNFAGLDFLANPAAVLVNLKPDDKGVVTIPRDAVAHANQLRIVAVDPLNTVCRDIVLPEVATPHQDLRLRLALDAEKHFTEKKQVTVLPEGQPLEIADITTSKIEVYDTLARVYRLFSTLSNNPTLTSFGFILRWPTLPESEKRAKYSEFACHELSFFLSRKDPEFFKKVIQPYLRNKKDKTFMDRYLLGDDLSAFRNPWAYGRLNVVERILLGRRIDDEGDPCARHIGDLNDLLPRDIERANHLFQSAILSSALEAGDELGIGRESERAEQMKMAKSEMPAMEAPAGAAAATVAKKRPRSGPKDKAGRRLADEKECEETAAESCADMDDSSVEGGDLGRGKRDMDARRQIRQFYQKLDKTQEWAENNYYHLPIEQQGPELVTVNAFWRDYAKHRMKGPFLSPNAAYASRNFTEMMCALAVLDLPFDAEKPVVTFQGAQMKLTGMTRSIAWHKEIKPAQPSAERVPVLVSQNYFRDDDRTRTENDEQVDKYVAGEFLVNVVYACQVVLTNPTSASQKLDLLMQIPQGAIPVKNGFVTKGTPVEISSYATESFEYAFYFPGPGTFPHFPVHVAKNEQLIASAEPTRLKVVREPSAVDKTSWAWLSQNGDPKDVLAWLDGNNIDRIGTSDDNGEVGLELIAWRMRDAGFYAKCIALLRRRHVWNNTLWAYSVHHRDVPNIREFLLHQDGFLDQCGLVLDSPLVRIEPVERRRYQHLEYAPLVNARTWKLGARRTILNDRFSEQFTRLMNVLKYRAAPSHDDLLATAYYLFLQDRVDEALETFDRVDAKKIETAIQYDYLRVNAEFFRERPANAREIAVRYKDHPVDRWRDLFVNALSQIDEITGAAAQVVDDRDRDQRQARLAATEPDFDFSVEKKTVTVSFQNLSAVRVNYYRMDIELLFSRQPFVQQQSAQFGFIRPNRSEEVALPAGRTTFSFDLPAEFHGANVIVELTAGARRKSQAYYAHDLLVQVVENYGQVRVTRQGTGEPLPKTYVKVYARMKGGEVKFYKDGYTDLRGKFDYTSLNTNELDYVDRFSLLILHHERGAVIREAEAPRR